MNYACRLVHDYPAIDRGLQLAGSCVVWERHLGAGVIGGLVGKEEACLFREWGGLLREVRGLYDRKGEGREAEVIGPVYEAEVLALDEPGAAETTAWER